MEFRAPPSNSKSLDFSNAATYTIGNILPVIWTEPLIGVAASLLLWRANATGDLIEPSEYLTQSVVNKTDYSWLIRTGLDLTASNLLQLTIYQEGEVEPDDFSQYFYLVDKVDSVSVSTSSTSSLLLVSSTSAATSSVSTAASSTHTSAPTTAPVPSTAAHANSFPISAKIGVGVGIPVALLLGLVVGFLLFRRHKKDTARQQTPDTQVAEQYKYGHYAPPLNEAPPESLVELDPQHAAEVHAHKTPNDGAASTRYEM
ncbi:uncharacterized protein ALTATR162_LOCUS10462 [Alternaria atra]|uniref:Mid2 domain-containing protein n=1 Tax=Alternaria atra TaxID=119953 RepID=A0A8J2IA28_9PLEO|nr:uncharacterized protein ALTATR162_LOCUS8279 [Alternaria atra]XP_043174033.1 uncharacterized protein ALTATR162_LOCUS10462 [Alternaria atra]CAG5176027.1 unnamed protein product [Alternaria atra]CAG5183199.1 unnamed protein product [Alternaria atra]